MLSGLTSLVDKVLGPPHVFAPLPEAFRKHCHEGTAELSQGIPIPTAHHGQEVTSFMVSTDPGIMIPVPQDIAGSVVEAGAPSPETALLRGAEPIPWVSRTLARPSPEESSSLSELFWSAEVERAAAPGGGFTEHGHLLWFPRQIPAPCSPPAAGMLSRGSACGPSSSQPRAYPNGAALPTSGLGATPRSLPGCRILTDDHACQRLVQGLST